MNTRTRNLIIAGVIILCVAGLIVALAKSNGGAPAAPATADATIASSTVAEVQITPGVTTAPSTMAQVTPSTTATVTQDRVAATPSAERSPTPAATLTRAEEILIEQQHDDTQSAASVEQCTEILKTEPGCNVVNSVQPISRPEWEQLLPQTRFYLGQYDRHYEMGHEERKYFLIVEQDGQRYIPKTYDMLLDANSIVITDENRELVAKAWALMTIPDYLEEEVNFTKWEKVSYTEEQARHPYNYLLLGWTKLGGWEVGWSFVFGNAHLEIASGPSGVEPQTGNYIEQLFEGVPSDYFASPFEDYVFTGGSL